MQYQCNEKHIFLFPDITHNGLVKDGVEWAWTETKVCPECGSHLLSEYVEVVTEEQIENVLVIELTSGPQIAIDKALADGYVIKNRYAKNYVLEKCKPKPEQKDITGTCPGDCDACNKSITERFVSQPCKERIDAGTINPTERELNQRLKEGIEAAKTVSEATMQEAARAYDKIPEKAQP